MRRADSAERTAEPASPQADSRSRRRFLTVLVRRTFLACAALLLAFVVAFGTLLLATPSVHNARQLASAIDRAHRADYLGVVVPYRFATSLVASVLRRLTIR